MKFENIISQISAVIASVVVFVFACGMYLSFKGFEFKDNGEIVLVKAANAKEVVKDVALNIALPKGHSIGDKDAPAKMYVFSSYGCFACAGFHLNAVPQIIKEFVDTKKLEIVFVDFPLDAASMQGGVLASCVPEKNYMKFADALFDDQREWARSKNVQEKLIEIAGQNGLNEEDAKKCLANKDIANNILADRQEAMTNIGIMATPSILIATKSERKLFQGAPSFLTLYEILNKN